MSAAVSVAGARRTFGGRRRGERTAPALDGIDLSVRPGELLVIMGPSGAGKSTLLRAIAGLERLDEGTIVIGDRDVTAAPPGARDVAMVFQEPALYPHLTVAENIGFGLRARRLGRDAVRSRVESAAAALAIGPLLTRRPGELSGGERQRVGLARALVREPQVFLMDEPLTSLDTDLRGRARAEIRELHDQLRTTTIHVTHDEKEALALGERIALLRAGRVEQIGTPLELFDHPRNAFVGRALGEPPMNVVPSSVLAAPDGKPWAGVRPEHFRIVDDSVPGGDAMAVRGEVVAVELAGSEAIVHVRVGQHELVVRHPRREALPSHSVTVRYSMADVHGFDEGA